jgi:putative ABC transport system permease protein
VSLRALLSAFWRSKLGPLLISAQIALSLAVLINVAFLVQRRVEEVSRPTGLDLKNMFWISTGALSKDFNYASAVSADLTYLNSMPQIVAASTINNLPQTTAFTGLPFAPTAEAAEGLKASSGAVIGQIYFGTDRLLDSLGLRLVAGRNFEPQEITPPSSDPDAALGNWAPVVIVTREMAKRLFPDGSALGKTVYVGLVNKSSTIVGIVDTLQAAPHSWVLGNSVQQIVIAPIIAPGPDGLYVVRAKPGRRAEVIHELQQTFADQQPGRFVSRIEDYTRTADAIRLETRATALILAIVSMAVLAVTIVGIGGLAAFNVSARTKQLGVRRAMGAPKLQIFRYFLIENWIIVTCGAVAGCLLALAAAVKLGHVFEGPRLPLSYVVGGLLLLWAIGFVAVLIPAIRAASVSPAVATRAL